MLGVAIYRTRNTPVAPEDPRGRTQAATMSSLLVLVLLLILFCQDVKLRYSQLAPKFGGLRIIAGVTYVCPT